ncbi:MAG: glycosyltransferase family 2 protein [Algicola sp.]|nr:glycosyltransferase family 2 protein [Algicola sp.]
MKLISILIAAYKAPAWLEECIDSINSQSLPEGWKMEILLGIDGCQPTLAVAKALNCQRLKIISITENVGTYITFNTLMTVAEGELICRFDADDVMNPGFLEKQMVVLQSNTDMTMTWSIFTDEKLQQTAYYLSHKEKHPTNGFHRRGADGQFVIKRAVWDTLGGFQPWRIDADSEFLARVKIIDRTIAVVEEYLYLRRNHPNSLTAHPDSGFESRMRIQNRTTIKDYINQYNQGTRPLKINPVCADSFSYLE